jgi:hypothetical protein
MSSRVNVWFAGAHTRKLLRQGIEFIFTDKHSDDGTFRGLEGADNRINDEQYRLPFDYKPDQDDGTGL